MIEFLHLLLFLFHNLNNIQISDIFDSRLEMVSSSKIFISASCYVWDSLIDFKMHHCALKKLNVRLFFLQWEDVFLV